MPTYNVDLTSERGDYQRIPFTLDDDRPLGAQLRHVLEELRARGTVLRGGPEDELGVSWNGAPLDLTKTLQALRVTAHHPIVLAMQRRAAPRASRAEPAPIPFLARGTYFGAIAGFTGAVFAWILATYALADLPPFLGSYGALDLAVGALLGGLAGAFILGVEEMGSGRSLPVGLLTGLLVGAAGGAIGCLIGGLLGGPLGMSTSTLGFRLTRLAAWAFLGACTGLALGLVRAGQDRRRVWDGLGLGAAAGLVGGLMMLLPGPTDLWQMLAFALTGTAIGYGVVGLGLKRAVGVVELEQLGERPVGLFTQRWWPVRDNSITTIAQRFTIETRGGRCQVVPAGAALNVAGETALAAVPLLNLDSVKTADAQFRFRRQPVAL